MSCVDASCSQDWNILSKTFTCSVLYKVTILKCATIICITALGFLTFYLLWQTCWIVLDLLHIFIYLVCIILLILVIFYKHVTSTDTNFCWCKNVKKKTPIYLYRIKLRTFNNLCTFLTEYLWLRNCFEVRDPFSNFWYIYYCDQVCK